MSVASCATCKFSHRAIVGPTKTVLQCRRYPPTIMLAGMRGPGQTMTAHDFPQPKPDWVCGEFQPDVKIEGA